MTIAQRITIWLRILVVQATWSYRRMQTLGWLWAIEPIVRSQSERPAERLNRLVVEFNTHALLSPLLFGAATRQLLLNIDNEQEATRQLTRWMSSFGALGDMIYWQAMWWTLIWIGGFSYILTGLSGLSIILAVWLVIEITMRILLFEVGLRWDDGISRAMKILNTPKIRTRFNQVGIFMMAVVAGYCFQSSLDHTPMFTIESQQRIFLLVLGASAAAASALLASRSRFRSSALWIVLCVGVLVRLIE